DLDEHRPPATQGAVALVDAAAPHRLVGAQAEGSGERGVHQPEVRRVLARFSRSTRMPMNARSNLLRHERLACSRSASRMRRTREGTAALTVAPRSALEAERKAISPKHSPDPRTLRSLLFLLTRRSPSSTTQK